MYDVTASAGDASGGPEAMPELFPELASLGPPFLLLQDASALTEPFPELPTIGPFMEVRPVPALVPAPGAGSGM